MAEVRVNRAALERHLKYGNDEVKDGLDRLGAKVADRAAVLAPKDTTFGATSIQHEVGEDEAGAYVRVSWANAAFYMYFHEVGTSKMAARPFLRPALDVKYDI